MNSFFDKKTSTFTYVIIDEKTKHCAVIDPVLDFDMKTHDVSFESMNKIVKLIEKENLQLKWILETHIHADHLTASYYLKSKLGGRMGIGKGVVDVYHHWQPIFNQAIPEPQYCFDALFKEGDKISLGETSISVLETPGHTPSCISYHVGDALFVGDTLFMPSRGTARVDFPGGSAKTLYQSISKMYVMKDSTCVYVGHDYPKEGEKAIGHTSLKQQKENNVMLNQNTSLEAYIEKRTARDSALDNPKLIRPALQVNLRAGKLDNQIEGVNMP